VTAAAPEDTPLRSGLKDIVEVALGPLVLLLPSNVGYGNSDELPFAILLVVVSSAFCGALAGGFIWLLAHGCHQMGHRTEPSSTGLGLASRDARQRSAGDRTL
jgi:hypothetical protein